MTKLNDSTIGKYHIMDLLGRGGMAEVYRAYQSGLDRFVAVKVLHGHLADDKDFVGRFEREAAAVARLRHPNIVQVYDFDVEGDRYYMVMEFIEGPTLRTELKERSVGGQTFTFAEATRILDALSSAIDYAHARGMVHRDLKPANIMFTNEGQVVLTDFGIARIVSDTHLTVTGAIVGTPTYMSPEQGQGERGDERSDIYSLGVVLYEMVTGRVPFDADTPFAVIMRHINDPLPSPREVNPEIPVAAEQVILKTLSKNPDDRYQTAGEMARALREAVGVPPGQTLAAMPIATIAPRPHAPEKPAVYSSAVRPGLDRTTSEQPTHVATVPVTTTSPQTEVPAPSSGTGLPILPIFLGVGAILVVSLIALGIIAFSQLGPGEKETRATQATPAEALVTQSTDTPAPSLTAAPTNTYTPAPTPTARVVVVTSTPQIVVVTPTPLPATDTPTPTSVSATDTPTSPTSTPSRTPTSSPTATPTSAPATPTPASPTAIPRPRSPELAGKLAFSLPQGTSFKVYVVEVGPAPPTGLYASVGNARQPALSSDGQWLLVNGTGGGIDAIARLASNGHQANPITCPDTTAESRRPVWSPDDQRIAFDGFFDPGRPQIYIQDADEVDCDLVNNRFQVEGGDAVEVNGLYPLWGPDDRVYFRSCATWAPGQESSCGVWSAQADGSGALRLTDNPNHLPTDVGRDRLLFMFNDAGNWDVYSVGLGGGQPRNLTNHPARDVWGTLSPDGRSIAFLSDRGGRWVIWLANEDGSNPIEWLPINSDWGMVDPDRLAQERMSWSE